MWASSTWKRCSKATATLTWVTARCNYFFFWARSWGLLMAWPLFLEAQNGQFAFPLAVVERGSARGVAFLVVVGADAHLRHHEFHQPGAWIALYGRRLHWRGGVQCQRLFRVCGDGGYAGQRGGGPVARTRHRSPAVPL